MLRSTFMLGRRYITLGVCQPGPKVELSGLERALAKKQGSKRMSETNLAARTVFTKFE